MKLVRKVKINFIVIPLCTILTAWFVNYFVKFGTEWYSTKLKLPAITPPNCVFSLVWKAIYILVTLVALYIYNDRRFKTIRSKALTLLIINSVSIITLNYLFFYKRALEASFFNTCITFITLAMLIKLIYPKSIGVVLLLMPYVFWMLFEVYLDGIIWFLNRSL